MGNSKRAWNALRSGKRDLGHGPWSEASSGWVDPKPYTQYWSNGLFEGYDGSIWKYYQVPEDVQIDWLLEPHQALENQMFFVDTCRRFGDLLDSQTEKTRGDIRRDFHVQVTQTPSTGIKPFAGSTPAHADFLERMSQQYGKPEWFGFIGIKLLPSTVFYEAYGFRSQVQRYIDLMLDPEAIQWALYKKDLDEVDTIMRDGGFREVDFIDSPQLFDQLTAWHGVPDEQYALPRQLQSTRMKEPIQGLSIITPKWGEVMFHALRPSDGNNLRDPLNDDARWAVPLYRPGSNVVLINIRGQVRAPSIADNLLDIKKMNKMESATKRTDDDPNALRTVDLIQMARSSVREVKLPMLDNIEIIIGSLVPEGGKTSTLPQTMKGYGLDTVPLIGRQHLAILSSFPTYPRHVMRIPRGNRKRPELTNVMLPGMLAMSGVFRNTRPCAQQGVMLGLSDAGDQYREIYTETDAAARYNRVPGMLVTGRPGAGKTIQLQQLTAQLAYMGLPVAFFNPKKEGTLQPLFDHIGGVTISMNRRYLEQNPGMLDPVFFLHDRKEVAQLIADAIFLANRMYDDEGSKANQRRTQIKTEIQERALDSRNTCSADIIFGNRSSNPAQRTHPISDQEVVQFVSNRMQTSQFWTAFIATNANASGLHERMTGGRSFLIEWDKSMQLPNADTPQKEYTDNQLDTVISVNITFNYASAIVGGTGGAIIVDESWVLKNSREALAILERGGREWRQANIMLIMGTQRIRDWMDSRSERAGTASAAANMATFFDRYLFMAINEQDNNELDMFFELTGLPRTKHNEHYITHAGASRTPGGSKGNSIPRAYYMDKIYDWAGGIICGPWPERELNLGRTDKEGLDARRALDDAESNQLSEDSHHLYSGALSAVLEDAARLDDSVLEDESAGIR